LRCALSYILPQETQWAEEDARTALAPTMTRTRPARRMTPSSFWAIPRRAPGPVGPYVTLLFTSLADVDLARGLTHAANRPTGGAIGARDIERAILDGRLAAGMSRFDAWGDGIVEALGHVAKLRPRALEALHAVAPRAVARAMVRRLGASDADADARAFLAAQPEDAMEALAEALGKGTRRALYAPVLSLLVATHRPLACELARRVPAPSARALARAGATDVPLTSAGAKKLVPAFARVGVPALARWLARQGSPEELASIVESAAADGARVPRLTALARATAATSPMLAAGILDALARVRRACARSPCARRKTTAVAERTSGVSSSKAGKCALRSTPVEEVSALVVVAGGEVWIWR
jgi:hypothetical protein